MEKRQLLFVTFRDKNITEGVSYAVELAKAMDEDIMILFVQRRTDRNAKFEDLMTAVAFAEAGEQDAAKQILSDPRSQAEDFDPELAPLFHKCRQEGVQATVHTSPLEALSGIRAFIKKQWGIDRVVLSPAITMAGEIRSKDMTRLVRSISRPVVTMARQPLAVASGNI